LELSLPTFDTVIHNSRIIFANQVSMSSNNIVQWFLSIGVLYQACVILLLLFISISFYLWTFCLK